MEKVVCSLCLLLLLGLSSCGVKGNPKPVDKEGRVISQERNSYPSEN